VQLVGIVQALQCSQAHLLVGVHARHGVER
jgi:hypothetical protein